tara:strand:- start:91 stop:687 length:597 start_codon:yes stop_codon:yes gene_type:complete
MSTMIVDSKKTEKDIDTFLRIPQGITITGFIVILISLIFNIFDMEIAGYYMISFSIFISFIVLLGYKLFISEKAQKQNDLEKPKTIFSKIFQALIIFKNRLPAVLLFGQFLSLSVILTMLKDWITRTKEFPNIYTRTKRFINLGLFVQFIIYQLKYVKSIKDNSLDTFNTAGFAIISLITFSLIMYLYVIAKLFIVDG